MQKEEKVNNNLDLLAAGLDSLLEDCKVCPHHCRINRKAGKKGFCQAGYLPVVYSAILHHGEEPPISGVRGSGTIFFSHCNMQCVYCQNYQISQEHQGKTMEFKELSSSMLELQHSGCHNINLVSPSIWIPQIVKSLVIAKRQGLSVPVVYNTGGYDDASILKKLEGLIDIYMPDIRYSNDLMAEEFSNVKKYVENNRAAIKEMYRQVGELELESKTGVALKGMLIRLLVLPDDAAGIRETLDFLKEELSTDIHLSIMAQYHPEYNACRYQKISRRITAKEYLEVTDYAEKLGFFNGWTQDHIALEPDKDLFRPDFKKDKVFRYYEDEQEKGEH